VARIIATGLYTVKIWYQSTSTLKFCKYNSRLRLLKLIKNVAHSRGVWCDVGTCTIIFTRYWTLPSDVVLFYDCKMLAKQLDQRDGRPETEGDDQKALRLLADHTTPPVVIDPKYCAPRDSLELYGGGGGVKRSYMYSIQRCTPTACISGYSEYKRIVGFWKRSSFAVLNMCFVLKLIYFRYTDIFLIQTASLGSKLYYPASNIGLFKPGETMNEISATLPFRFCWWPISLCIKYFLL
jgi:hypothetical protein